MKHVDSKYLPPWQEGRTLRAEGFFKKRAQSTLEWVGKENMRFIGSVLQNLASDHDFSPQKSKIYVVVMEESYQGAKRKIVDHAVSKTIHQVFFLCLLASFLLQFSPECPNLLLCHFLL